MFNMALLIGNLGAAPELRYTASGKAVASFSLATNKSFTDAAGVRQDKTQWHKIICWEKTAQNVAKFLTKGSKALVKGEIEYREWTDDNGGRRFATEIQAHEVKFLDSKADRPQDGRTAEEVAMDRQRDADTAALPGEGQGAGPGGLPF